MTFKASAPKEDAETKRRREQAEDRADSQRVEGTKRDLDRLTQDLLRAFGRKSAIGGLAGGPASAAGGGGASAGGATGGGSFDPGFNIFVDPLSEGGAGDRFPSYGIYM